MFVRRSWRFGEASRLGFSGRSRIPVSSTDLCKAGRASSTKIDSVLFQSVNLIRMNNLIILLLVAATVSFPICSALGQIATGSKSTTAQATFTSSPSPNEHRTTDKETKEVSASDVQEKSWTSEVWFPIIRFLGIAVIIGVLLWFIDLPAFLKGDAWPTRTVSALIRFQLCGCHHDQCRREGADGVKRCYADCSWLLFRCG